MANEKDPKQQSRVRINLTGKAGGKDVRPASRVRINLTGKADKK
ncbi:hypothetical protein [Kitasatospora cathayae]|uniref:Uncharacterized protein n=1 Tax=Kitasatospora cathayae TaxID=3004092 RepID=A0ABY7QGQ8_9ACTN|nr:hypothetical protein [Kitasatospora sp. HUAS 3-15]WBP91979.1 hypothetical protein O1G21_40015 [Kitasatospora sp. HUAS 3-15]